MARHVTAVSAASLEPRALVPRRAGGVSPQDMTAPHPSPAKVQMHRLGLCHQDEGAVYIVFQDCHVPSIISLATFNFPFPRSYQFPRVGDLYLVVKTRSTWAFVSAQLCCVLDIMRAVQ